MRKLSLMILAIIVIVAVVIPVSAAGYDTEIGNYTISGKPCLAEFTVSDGTNSVLPGFYATSTVESGSLSVVGVEGFVYRKSNGSRYNFSETGIYAGTHAFAQDGLQIASTHGWSTHTFGSQATYLYADNR